MEAISSGELPVSYSVGVTSDQIGADGFEEDDTPEMAKWISWQDGQFQEHNFHDEGDEDWVFFYALATHSYKIEVFDEGVNSDVVLELYEDIDGDLNLLEAVNDSQGNGEVIELFRADTDGLYRVRIHQANPSIHGIGTRYKIKVTDETGGIPGILMVLVHDRFSNDRLLEGEVSAEGIESFDVTDNVYIQDVAAGTYEVAISVNGYEPNPAVQTTTVEEDQLTEVHFYLDPVAVWDHKLVLKQGWNLISVPVNLADFSMETLFAGNSQQASLFDDRIWTWDGVTYQSASQLHPGKGYWIKSPVETFMETNGSIPESLTESYEKGWQLVGVKGENAFQMNDSIDTRGTVWGWDSENQEYYMIDSPSLPPGRQNKLLPGHGYWMYFGEPTTLEFD